VSGTERKGAVSSIIEEAIVERLRALDAEEQKKVLDFVEGIERHKRQPAKSLWDSIQDIVKDVPDEVWERLPTDGSEQHDHYLYGSPKK
jgi:hypothetical protein